MPTLRPSFLWPLRVIAVLSIVAPALIFLYSAWQTRHAVEAQASERTERALDVLQEHALKSLQTVERAIAEINEVLRDLPDDQIRGMESDLAARFKRTQQALPQMESIWAFDALGHPLVSSTIFPVPRELNNSDRSYFQAAKTGTDAFVSEVVRARVGSMRFFVVSGRRVGPFGQFNGAIGVTVTPEHFTQFYRKLSRGRDSFGLVRHDGSILARFPDGPIERTAAPKEVAEAITANPESGTFESVSRIDGLSRKIGYRRVPGFPVYAMAGIEAGALTEEFWRTLAIQFVLGFPVALAVFGLALLALRRGDQFREETLRREAAESALKQSQRLEALGQLTGGVAHDFNNLLMVVAGNIHRLKRVLSEDQTTRRAVNAIETAVKRGTDLTRHLLSFSRRQTHETQVIHLQDKLYSLRELLQSSLRGDIRIELQIDDNLPNIEVDPSELELAILNLAVNARDAMPSGGQLSISAREVNFSPSEPLGLQGKYVALGVQDTGEGMPSDIAAKAFEPFFTTKDVGKGTGLGLSQVYGFAKQAGGAATIESKEGLGTLVTLYLPPAPHRKGQPRGVSEDRRTARPARQHGTVLLVEDNPDVAAVSRENLLELGYEVISAADVASALECIAKGDAPIDIVLSDIVMPGGQNGLDLARAIRQRYGHQRPVILATGYSEVAQAATDEGFILLRKPYGIAALSDALQSAQRRTLVD